MTFFNISCTMNLLLLSHFSHVRLCVTPQTAAHQAPLSLGFSRQEHWSGLPVPPPVHQGEKWKWSCSVVSDCSQPHRLLPTRLLHPWEFPGQSTGVGLEEPGELQSMGSQSHNWSGLAHMHACNIVANGSEVSLGGAGFLSCLASCHLGLGQGC